MRFLGSCAYLEIIHYFQGNLNNLFRIYLMYYKITLFIQFLLWNSRDGLNPSNSSPREIPALIIISYRKLILKTRFLKNKSSSSG